ncbi:MAG: putative endonuclease [Flavobacteriales bacterium]
MLFLDERKRTSVTVTNEPATSTKLLLSGPTFFPLLGMMTTTEKGNKGEEMACIHLLDLGYTVLEKQWRFGRNEIDLIARNEASICFIEVKLRDNDWAGAPHAFVSKDKQRRVIRAAHQYLSKHMDEDLEARFDIVSILHNSKRTEIEHIENAFFPML